MNETVMDLYRDCIPLLEQAHFNVISVFEEEETVIVSEPKWLTRRKIVVSTFLFQNVPSAIYADMEQRWLKN